jgi:DNA-binding Lrp family transcriptional regulator
VPDERLEQVAQVINAHPGVSHNYQRAHRFNLWFTLSVPSPLDITRHVRALARLATCSDVLYLPSVKMFKRRVRFALDDTQTPLSSEKKSVAPHLDTAANALPASLSPEVQRQLMQALQQDLPLTPTPFKALADRFQVSDEVFFAFLHYLQASHKMSRFSGIVRHRKLGFTANAMVVWQIPAAQAPNFVKAAIAYEAVSHCYERVTYPHWPYNLYTMIHGTSRDVTEQVIATLAAQEAAVAGYEVLYSTREFKKQRVDYFSGAIEAWDAAYVGNGGEAA